MIKNFGLLVPLSAAMLALLASGSASGALVFFTDDQAGWEAALAAPSETFAFNASNIVLADEIDALPASARLGEILTYEPVTTGLSTGFAFLNDPVELPTVDPSKEIFFAAAGPGLGTITFASSEHDWRVEISDSTPVFAVGMSISAALGDPHDFFVDGVMLPSNPVSFLGVISDAPINTLLYDDQSESGGRVVLDIRFGQVTTIPLPGAIIMISTSLMTLLLIMRKNTA